jgi:hypothetical protein
MSDPTVELAPGDLFVVECPICRGHVAAAVSLRGRAACCPLCASLFLVPFPLAAATPSGEPAGEPLLVDRPRAEPAANGLGEDWGPVIEKLTPPRRAEDVGHRPAPESPAASEPPAGDRSPVEPAVAEPPPAEPPAALLPGEFPESPPPRAGELAFTEPVRTVRVGGEVIEIRRLSPEERRRRRFRRNLLLIVIGISILLAIVAVFGTPPRR